MAKQNKSCAFRTSIGGQALIEGILMRGPEKQAIVVRDPGGPPVEKVEELRFIKDRYPILGLPLVRGTVNFLGAMVSGVKALMYSADFLSGGRGGQAPQNLSFGWKSTSQVRSWKAPWWRWRCCWAWG